MEGSCISCMASSRLDFAREEGDGTPAMPGYSKRKNGYKTRCGLLPVMASTWPLVMKRGGEGESLSEELLSASSSGTGGIVGEWKRIFERGRHLLWRGSTRQGWR
jgi:hypothetical protein